jgi:hypothetical protein
MCLLQSRREIGNGRRKIESDVRIFGEFDRDQIQARPNHIANANGSH